MPFCILSARGLLHFCSRILLLSVVFPPLTSPLLSVHALLLLFRLLRRAFPLLCFLLACYWYSLSVISPFRRPSVLRLSVSPLFAPPSLFGHSASFLPAKMIDSSSFWETEAGAPLLKRNCGYLTEENAKEMTLQAQKLVDFVESFVSQISDDGSFDVLSISAPAVSSEDKERAGRGKTTSSERKNWGVTQYNAQKGSEQREQDEETCSPGGGNFEGREEGVAEAKEGKQLTQTEEAETCHHTPCQTVLTRSPAARVSPDAATTEAGVGVAGTEAAGPAAEKADAKGKESGETDAGEGSSSSVPLSACVSAGDLPDANSSPPLASPAVISSSLPSTTCSSVAPSGVPPAFQRIYALDAERTFREAAHRQQMITVLSRLHPDVLDYHQGMGFLVAFLLLFLPPQAVHHVVVLLHRHYVPGYFAAAPAAYVRDARVYQKLLQKFYPDVAHHIEQFTCPEAYVSKWFIGMNIHVLPFAALMCFFENFFQKGEKFLFQFALALVKNVRPLLLQSHDVATILAILRLDEKLFPDSASIASALPYAAAAATKRHAAPYPPVSISSTAQTTAAPAAGEGGGGGRTCLSATTGEGKLDLAGDAVAPHDKAASIDEKEKQLKENCETPGSFFLQIVKDASTFDLCDSDIEKLRQEALEEMRVEEEKRKEREKQLGLDDDDEIIFSDEEDGSVKDEEKEKREDE